MIRKITISILVLVLCFSNPISMMAEEYSDACKYCGKQMWKHSGISLYGNTSLKKIHKTKLIKKIYKKSKGVYVIKTKSLKLYNNIKEKHCKTKAGGYEGSMMVDGELVYGAGKVAMYRTVCNSKNCPKGSTKYVLKLTKKELKSINNERLSKKGKKDIFKYWTRKGEMAMGMTEKEAKKEFKKRYYKKGKYYYPYISFSIRGGVWQASYIDYTECGGGYSGHEGWLEYGKYQTFNLKTY